MPVIFIATEGRSLDKILSNMEEIIARAGKVIAISSQDSKSVCSVAKEVIEIPRTNEVFVPFLATLPLQMIAYQIAVLGGCDVDKPRNLAKSVTVE